MGESSGISLAIATAVVSGVSIFLNKFAVGGTNPFVFTALKNVFVAVFLLSAIFLLFEFKKLKELTKKQWGQLALVGLVGGSVPFLLFFYALKLTSAVNAGFLQKTLFIWAIVFAGFFLKEKYSKKFLAGAALLLVGNFALFSKFSSFGFADALILIAAILWGAENVLSKHVLKETHGRIVAFGRMFFGSLFMLAFLAATGQITEIGQLNFSQLSWVLVTSALLFLYVLFYYTGLKYVRVGVAAALLSLGQPITAILSLVFSGTPVSASDALGFVLIIFGAAIIAGFGYFVSVGKTAAKFFATGNK
ncbi:MAG: DMT family transporter [archaeon]